MNELAEIKLIIDRFDHSPLNLVPTELETLLKVIQRNPYLAAIIANLRLRNDSIIGARAADIVKNGPSSHWLNLEYANSAELRATVGYQVLEILVDLHDHSICQKRVWVIAEYYCNQSLGPYKIHSPIDATREFSNIFLKPLVSYLEASHTLEDDIVFKLSRYKQRCESFPEQDFIDQALDPMKPQFEKRLRKDLLRYLFDANLVFSVESEPVSEHSKVDILQVQPGQRFMPVETKVHDGKNRDLAYISQGVAQIIDYGRRFGTRLACYLVYNVHENTQLLFGAPQVIPGVFRATSKGIDVLAISINVMINLSSSDAYNIKTIEVTIPV
jgi:hypothetical protein